MQLGSPRCIAAVEMDSFAICEERKTKKADVDERLNSGIRPRRLTLQRAPRRRRAELLFI